MGDTSSLNTLEYSSGLVRSTCSSTPSPTTGSSTTARESTSKSSLLESWTASSNRWRIKGGQQRSTPTLVVTITTRCSLIGRDRGRRQIVLFLSRSLRWQKRIINGGKLSLGPITEAF